MVLQPKWAASSAGRALRSQCRGRGFDPPAVHQIAAKLSRHTRVAVTANYSARVNVPSQNSDAQKLLRISRII
jgi:hypothetical protein